MPKVGLRCRGQRLNFKHDPLGQFLFLLLFPCRIFKKKRSCYELMQHLSNGFGSYLQSEDEASDMDADGSEDDEGSDWENED